MIIAQKGIFTTIIKFVFISSTWITQYYHPMASSLEASHLEYTYIRTQSLSFGIPKVFCYATLRLCKFSTLEKQQVFSLGQPLSCRATGEEIVVEVDNNFWAVVALISYCRWQTNRQSLYKRWENLENYILIPIDGLKDGFQPQS